MLFAGAADGGGDGGAWSSPHADANLPAAAAGRGCLGLRRAAEESARRAGAAVFPPEQEDQLLAAFGAGFSLMASVVDHPVEPGYSGPLPLAHLAISTSEFTEGGIPLKFEWSPGDPGDASLEVIRYEGGTLNGSIQATIFAPGLYHEATGAQVETELSVRFHARDYDPMNLHMGCDTVD